jgi:putative membrane protein
MGQIWQDSQAEPRPSASLVDYGAYVAIFGLGILFFWLSTFHPSLMPFWAPWEFSPAEFLALALSLYWFCRGATQAHATERLSNWRWVAFLSGVALLYFVLQTRFEYWSQHMFFLNRTQHVVMHHIAPFLIALSWPGAAIKRGMPRQIRAIVENRTVVRFVCFFQQPWLAAPLFVGLFYFWLIPSIHFRAMIDGNLYALMNWSMVLDGILFWCLVLDPRPKPPARAAFGTRAALAFGVMFPQIVLGAVISFAPTDIYPYYNLCGRLFPSIGALNDQQIGGIISWIPPGMMSVVGVLLVLNFLRLHEDAETESLDEESQSMVNLSNSWTGR